MFQSKESEVGISIYDKQGKLLVKKNISCEAGTNSKVLDVSLPNGAYIVRLVSDEFSVSQKVIK